jgi:predicted phage baseplate assembly protein
VTDTVTSCGCDPLRAPDPVVDNLPAQPALSWRVAPHGHALARMQEALGERRPAPDDPVHAVLDAWAVVADVVSFYTERIAQEGFLRTATELRSVRLLARAIGYELRPGVAAQAEIAFEVEDAPGAPAAADVPAGTPVKSIPGQDELPQTFETAAALDARAAWNAVPAATTRPQSLSLRATSVWARGTALGLREGDAVVLVGAERSGEAPVDPDPFPPGPFPPGPFPPDPFPAPELHFDDWDLRLVTTVQEDAGGHAGWTLVGLQERADADVLGVGVAPVEAYAFARRAAIFGANAPDPALLTGGKGQPDPPTGDDWDGMGNPLAEGTTDVVELDGDQPRIVDGSWLVLERADDNELYRVEATAPGGAARFALSGKITRVRVDVTTGLSQFGRRETIAHCESRELDVAEQPVEDPLGGRTLELEAADPPLPAGRSVLVTGFAPGTVPHDPLVAAATPPPLAEPAVIAACVVVGTKMVVTLDRDLVAEYDPQTLRVRANVVAATHGETVSQVLGSGDATQALQRMVTRRGPLTYVGAATASGSKSTLEVRVDDVVWEQVESLDEAGPTQRVVTARAREDGTVTVTAGDGVHGARLPTGTENVKATYRAGIGADGALVAGQLTLLPRRPLGIRGATNPGATHDWAAPEAITEARTNGPLRIRTLDRAVSIADHGDFAAGFAGVALARADGVWDGHEQVVVVSLLGPGGVGVGDGLLADLTAALALARDPASRFVALRGEVVRFGIRVELARDPAYERPAVDAAVVGSLLAAFAAGALPLAGSLAESRALVTVRSTPGVVACTMPRLVAVTGAPGAPTQLAPDAAADEVLVALTGRLEDGALLAAQTLGLVDDGVQIGEMTP